MTALGCIFIVVLGTLGHFLFEWCSHSHVAGLFFAVNESTWEHIKLTIYPTFLWAGVEIACGGLTAALPVAVAGGLVTTMLLVPGLFYGYTAVTRKNWLVPDIICFIIAVYCGMLVHERILGAGEPCNGLVAVSLAVLALILVLYFLFSYHPPHNFLFKDPVSGGYGPKGHDCHAHFHSHR